MSRATFAAELVWLTVDVIVTRGTAIAVGAKRATSRHSDRL
jgi:hypothetical protein